MLLALAEGEAAAPGVVVAVFPALAEVAADWSGLVGAAPALLAAEGAAPGVVVAAVSPLALGAVPVVLAGCEA